MKKFNLAILFIAMVFCSCEQNEVNNFRYGETYRSDQNDIVDFIQKVDGYQVDFTQDVRGIENVYHSNRVYKCESSEAIMLSNEDASKNEVVIMHINDIHVSNGVVDIVIVDGVEFKLD